MEAREARGGEQKYRNKLFNYFIEPQARPFAERSSHERATRAIIERGTMRVRGAEGGGRRGGRVWRDGHSLDRQIDRRKGGGARSVRAEIKRGSTPFVEGVKRRRGGGRGGGAAVGLM